MDYLRGLHGPELLASALSDPSEALKRVQRNVQWLEDPESNCWALQAKALAHSLSGDLELMDQASQMALALARESVSSALSDALATRGAFGVSTENFILSDALTAEGLGSATGHSRARLLSCRGRSFAAQGRLTAAAALFEEATVSCNPGTSLLALQNNLAVTKILLGQFSEAEQLLLTVAESASSLQLAVIAESAKRNAALVLLAQGFVSAGVSMFDGAAERLRELGVHGWATQIDRCRLLLDLGLAEDASRLATGLQLAQNLGSGQRRELRSAIVESALQRGEWEQISEGSSGADTTDTWENWCDLIGDAVRLASDEPTKEPMLARQMLKSPWATTTRGRNLLVTVGGDAAIRGLDTLAFLLADAEIGSSSSGSVAELIRLIVGAEAIEPTLPALIMNAAAELFGGPDAATHSRRWARRLTSLAVRYGLATNDLETVGRVMSTIRRQCSVDLHAPPDEIESLLRQRRALSMSSVVGHSSVSRQREELDRNVHARLAVLPLKPAVLANDVGVSQPTVLFDVVSAEVVALVFVPGGAHSTLKFGPVSKLTQCLGRLHSSTTRMMLAGTESDAMQRRWVKDLADLSSVLSPLSTVTQGGAVDLIVHPLLGSVPWGALPVTKGVAIRIVDYPLKPAERKEILSASLIAGPGTSSGAEELERIAPIFKNITLGEHVDVTADVLLAKLDGVSVGHVCAHGSLRQNLLFSELMLGDIAFPIAELLKLTRLPNVFVLSACLVGSLATVGHVTESVGSLLRNRGCEHMVMSTLPLQEASLPEFMASFYGSLVTRGCTPAEALAAAHSGALDRGDFGCVGFLVFGIGDDLAKAAGETNP